MSWELKWNNPLQPQGRARFDIPDAVYSWSASHAAIAHEGATLRNGTVIPARPWTELATKEYDHPHQFVYHYRQLGSLAKAFERTAEEFGGVCQDAITSRVWQWDGTTVRKSGEIAGSPRNIVDTGELKDSYKLEFK